MCRGELDEQAAEALIQRLTREAFAGARHDRAPLSGRARPGAQSRPRSASCWPAWRSDEDGATGAVRDLRRAAAARLLWLRLHRPSDLRPDHGAADACSPRPPSARRASAIRKRQQALDRAEQAWLHRPPRQARSGRGACAVADGHPRRRAPIVRQVYELAFDVARELYPDDWRRLRPRLLTLATWVGYDTDGRADIGWTTTFAKRLMSSSTSCATIGRWSAPAWRAPAARPHVAPLLELLEARLALAIKSGRGRSGRAGRSRPAGFRSGASGWRAPPRTWWPAAAARLADAARCSIWSIARWPRSGRRGRPGARAFCAPSWRRRGWSAPGRMCGSTRSSCTTRSARRSAWTTRRTTRRTG